MQNTNTTRHGHGHGGSWVVFEYCTVYHVRTVYDIIKYIILYDDAAESTKILCCSSFVLLLSVYTNFAPFQSATDPSGLVSVFFSVSYVPTFSLPPAAVCTAQSVGMRRKSSPPNLSTQCT